MIPIISLVAGLAAINAVNAMPFTIPYLDKTGRVEVQGHRGGLGMRSEESLWVRQTAKNYDRTSPLTICDDRHLHTPWYTDDQRLSWGHNAHDVTGNWRRCARDGHCIHQRRRPGYLARCKLASIPSQTQLTTVTALDLPYKVHRRPCRPVYCKPDSEPSQVARLLSPACSSSSART